MIKNQNKPWRWRFAINLLLHSAVYTVWWLKKSYFGDIASHYKCIILIFINIQHRAINFLVSYQISVNWCPSNISSAFCHVRYNCKMWLVAISRPFCNKPDGCTCSNVLNLLTVNWIENGVATIIKHLLKNTEHIT